MSDHPNLIAARAYVRAVAAGATGDDLAKHYCADVVQVELPNKLNPTGVRRTLSGILEGALRGQAIMAKQDYEILHEVCSGSSVAMELGWIGTLKVAVGTLPAGGQMKARFAIFLEYRDGKIAAQRNYDCFEAW